MDYTAQNDKDREFFKKDFSQMNELMKRIREAFVNSKSIKTDNLNLEGIIDFVPNFTHIYVSLFQAGLKPLKWGSCRATLDETLNRIVRKIKEIPAYKNFDVKNSNDCRIMIEYVIEEIPTKLSDIKYATFVPARFEPGVTGIKIVLNGENFYYMPTDAWVNSQMDMKTALNTLLRKTYIRTMTNRISERINILKETPHECFIIKSRTFITYKDGILPLYRGNLLYKYSPEAIRNIAMAGADWTLKYQKEDGKYHLHAQNNKEKITC